MAQRIRDRRDVPPLPQVRVRRIVVRRRRQIRHIGPRPVRRQHLAVLAVGPLPGPRGARDGGTETTTASRVGGGLFGLRAHHPDRLGAAVDARHRRARRRAIHPAVAVIDPRRQLLRLRHRHRLPPVGVPLRTDRPLLGPPGPFHPLRLQIARQVVAVIGHPTVEVRPARHIPIPVVGQRI